MLLDPPLTPAIVRDAVYQAGSKEVQWGTDSAKAFFSDTSIVEPDMALVDISSSDAFSSDAPIISSSQDALHRIHFAQRIAETLMRRPVEESLVVGLYGKWGSGKSSVFNMMQEKLEEDKNTIVIKFNPWYFSSEEDLIRGFFAELNTGIGRVLPDIKKYISKFAYLLTPFSARFALPIVDGCQLTIDGDKAKKAIDGLLETSLEQEKKAICDILAKEKKRIIIFIDDIDRLDKAETHLLFKLVKLMANFPYTAYVLAFDDVVVAKAIGERYGEGEEAGQKFLEKIVQVPLHIPAFDKNTLERILFSKIDNLLQCYECELSDNEFQDIAQLFSYHLMPYFFSLRKINQYINSLNFILPLLKDEVNIADLIALEIIRNLFPTVYLNIYTKLLLMFNDYWSIRSKKEDLEILRKDIFYGLKDNEKDALEYILKQILPVFYTIVSVSSSEMLKNKKLCSKYYYYKYFQFSIPEGSVSELALKMYIEKLCSDGNNARKESIEEIHNKGIFLVFFRYIRAHIDDFSEEQCESIVKAISESSEKIIENKQAFIEDPFGSAVAIVAQLIGKCNKKIILLKMLITQAKNIPLSLSCLYSCIKNECITEAEGTLLKADILELIKITNTQAPLYLTFENNRGLYYLWSALEGTNDIQESIRQRLEAHPAELYIFLHSFCSFVSRSSRVNSFEFQKNSYDNIIPFLDVNSIPEILKGGFGIDMSSAVNEEAPSEMPEEIRIVNQFAYWHNKALEEATIENSINNENATIPPNPSE